MQRNTNVYAPWLNQLPVVWNVDRLKDLCPIIAGGGTPSSSEPSYWEDGKIIWLTPTDFSDGSTAPEIFDSERKITRAGLESCSATLLPRGAVIMASRATIGAVRIAGTELTTNQGFISFVCDEVRLHKRFLYYTIVGYLGDYFAEIAPGTTFNEISRGKAKQEPIGFPSIAEQILIADYLDVCCSAVADVTSLNKVPDELSKAKGVLHRNLEVLLAYRKSLIHECVTGQRHITEADVQRAAEQRRFDKRCLKG